MRWIEFVMVAAVVSGCTEDDAVDLLNVPGAGGEVGPRENAVPPEQLEYRVCTDSSQRDTLGYFSSTYERSCAGCHGEWGEGNQVLTAPPLPGALTDFDALVQVVRSGKGEKMPAFSAEAVPEDALRADWERMRAAPVAERKGLAELRPGPALAVAMSPENIETTIADGLAMWRKRGDKGACASCHGPEGVDLARLGFSDADILRRAMGQELTSDEAQRIVRMIHAVRAKYDMTEFCDPRAPFLQPGHELLPGDDHRERDMALGDELESHGIAFSGPLVHELDEAHAIVRAFLETGMINVRIGFPMNRWTEDRAFGQPHLSSAEWIPEYPREPRPELRDAWYALHDDYIADPSDVNLWRIVDAIGTHTSPAPAWEAEEGRFADWNERKYASVLVAQHLIRTNVFEPPRSMSDDELEFMLRGEKGELREAIETRAHDAIWDVGETMTSSGGIKVDELRPDMAEFTMETTRLGMSDEAFHDDTRRAGIPWMWLAHAFDPARQFINGGNSSVEYYVTKFPGREGRHFPIHQMVQVLVFIRMGEYEATHPDYPVNGRLGGRTGRNGIWTMNHGMWGYDQDDRPQVPGVDDYADLEPEHRAMAVRMQSNFWRMIVLLLTEQIEYAGQCPDFARDDVRGPTPEHMEVVRDFLLRHDPADERAWIDARIDHLEDLLLACDRGDGKTLAEERRTAKD